MAYKNAYVFACNLSRQYQLVGLITVGSGAGTFEYNNEWLQAPWAYPLDPVNLPLSSKRYRAVNRHGLFGVFRDAAPDDWGTRIMLLRNQHAPANELERLLRTSGGGVGCLRFSLSRSRALTPAELPQLNLIASLAELAARVDAKAQLQPEELALLEPGSSMGGARPKVTVIEQNEPWLVKFSKNTDLVDVPLLEYCSARFLAEQLKLKIPPVQLYKLGKQHAFAIKRFDQAALLPRHFISANSLFHQDKIRQVEDSKRNPYSYCNLAKIIRQHCVNFKEDANELFKRMVANIVMGNTDDHARNHALLCDIETGQWQLSPAYDMLPTIGGTQGYQALGVGQFGSKSTVENALSYASLFALKMEEAQNIVNDILTAYKEWPDFCASQGVLDGDLKLIRQCLKVSN